jgi:hypothetical protein
MKSLLSVLVLAFGALTFQSCEDYPNGASRGYYHGGYYGGVVITMAVATTMAATTGR